MPKKQIFLDSSVIIRGILDQNCNSGIVLGLIADGEIKAAINQKVAKEVASVMKRLKDKDFASKTVFFLLANFEVVDKDRYGKLMPDLRGRVKEKDLEHIATVKSLGLEYLVAYDRDFEPFKEYMTPREFLKALGKECHEGEY